MTTVTRESVRRLALFITIPIGVLMIAWPASELLSVRAVDWDAERRHEIAALLSEEARRDLNAYIREQTEGHVITLPVDPWQTFVEQVRETLAGRPPTATWKAATEWNEYYHKVRAIYLDPDDPHSAKLSQFPEFTHGYAYLRSEDEKSTAPSLYLQRLDFSLTHSAAPQYLIYPLRHAGWWVILAGLLIYALIPWPRPASDQFCPVTPGMAFLIDVVGVILYGTFLGIWSNLILEPSIPGHGEWSQIVVFTLVFGGMAQSGTAILIVALWYITFRLQWDDEGLRRRTLIGDRFQGWNDVRGLSLQPRVYRFAKRVRAVALFLSVFNRRVAGPALLMQTESACLHLSTREGDGWNIDLGNLNTQGLAGLLQAFRQRGIPVSPEVSELCRAAEREKPQPRTLLIFFSIALLGAFVAFFIYRTKPPASHSELLPSIRHSIALVADAQVRRATHLSAR